MSFRVGSKWETPVSYGICGIAGNRRRSAHNENCRTWLQNNFPRGKPDRKVLNYSRAPSFRSLWYSNEITSSSTPTPTNDTMR